VEVTQVTAHGRVRWVSPFGSFADPTPGMGIEFIGIDAHRRDQIDRLLRKD
jgi:Tfp pilus assembly protein PilZ